MLSGSALYCEDYGSTLAYSVSPIWSTGITGSGTRDAQSGQQQQITAQRQQALYEQMVGRLSRQQPTAPITQPAVKKGLSMVDEFKSYVREYKDWIFTIAIIAVIDHFFLDGALKEKLSAALGKKLEANGETK
jgi:hypothetical protein